MFYRFLAAALTNTHPDEWQVSEGEPELALANYRGCIIPPKKGEVNMVTMMHTSGQQASFDFEAHTDVYVASGNYHWSGSCYSAAYQNACAGNFAGVRNAMLADMQTPGSIDYIAD